MSQGKWIFCEWERIVNDCRFALRSLRRSPGFATIVILTLALGIGANTAIFNLLHAVILRSLPVPDAEQLRLFSVIDVNKVGEPIFSYPVLRQMQAATGDRPPLAGFSAISTMRTTAANGESEPVDTQLVTGNFFRVLAVKARIGQLLLGSDDTFANGYPAVLSGAFWAKRFGSDPSIIGISVLVNDTRFTIVGIAPSSFFGVSPGTRPDIWVPVAAQHDLRYNSNVWNSNGDGAKSFLTQPQIRWLSIIARVSNPGVTARTTALVNQIYARDMQREVKGRDPAEARDLLQTRIRLDAGDRGLASLRHQFSAPLTVLMCAAGFVLLIASVNLASLALARVVGRRKEFAVRRSVGATGGRIVSQSIAEILVLSLTGGVIAIPVALGVSRLLVRWASRGESMPLDLGISPSMLLFAGSAAVIMGFAFGLLPALEVLNVPLADAMKAQASSVKGMRLPWGRTLIAIQTTFSFVLLTAAILFVRTFINYTNLDLGFVPEHILSIRIDPLGAHYKTEQLTPLYHRILDRLSAVPGVQSASFASSELAVRGWTTSGIRVHDHPAPHQKIKEVYVSPSYFSTVGMRSLSGRFFDAHDSAPAPILAVINQAAARKYFPGESPLGRRFGVGYIDFEIIGVVADARVDDVHRSVDPMAFYSLEQSPQFANNLEVRAKGDPKQIEQSVRAVIRQSAPGLPVMRIRLLTELLATNLLREKLVARLASAFALLALALACLGVYGVLAYAVMRRTSEIGIRLALGAETAQVRWMVLREALAVILVGLSIGIPVAIAVTHLIKSLLYGLAASDPASLIAAAFTISAIGLTAGFIPAWRASRVDPNVVLRYE